MNNSGNALIGSVSVYFDTIVVTELQLQLLR